MSLFLEIITFLLCFETKSLQSYRSYFLAICHSCVLFVGCFFVLNYVLSILQLLKLCYHRALPDFQLLRQVFSPEHHDRSLAVMQTICFLVTVSSDIVRVFVVVKQLIYVQYFQTGRKFFNLFLRVLWSQFNKLCAWSCYLFFLSDFFAHSLDWPLVAYLALINDHSFLLFLAIDEVRGEFSMPP